MDDAMVRDANASPEATATIVAVDGRTINFKMSIKGIDGALPRQNRPTAARPWFADHGDVAHRIFALPCGRCSGPLIEAR